MKRSDGLGEKTPVDTAEKGTQLLA